MPHLLEMIICRHNSGLSSSFVTNQIAHMFWISPVENPGMLYYLSLVEKCTLLLMVSTENISNAMTSK